MWGNITKHVGAAIQKVQKLQNELESQLDAAVGAVEGASMTVAGQPSPLSTTDLTESNFSSIEAEPQNEKEGMHNEDQMEIDVTPIAEEEYPPPITSMITSSSTDSSKEVAEVAGVSSSVAVRIEVDPDDDWNFDKTPDEQPHQQQQEQQQFVSPSETEIALVAELSISSIPSPIPTSEGVYVEDSVPEIQIKLENVIEIPIEYSAPAIQSTPANENIPSPPLSAVVAAPQVVSVSDSSVGSVPKTPPSGKKKAKGKAKARTVDAAPVVLPLDLTPTLVSVPVSAPVAPILPSNYLPILPGTVDSSVAVKVIEKVKPAAAVIADYSTTGLHNGHDDAMPTPTPTPLPTPLSTPPPVASEPIAPTIIPAIIPSTIIPAVIEIMKSGSSFIDDDAVDPLDPVGAGEEPGGERSGETSEEIGEEIGEETVPEPTVAEVTIEFEQKIIELESKHLLALEVQRRSNDQRIERMELEAEAQALADKTLNDFYASAQAEMNEADNSTNNAETAAHIAQLNELLLAVKKDLSAALTANTQKESIIAKLTQDTLKINEVITERERALETYAVKMAETHKQFEAAQRRILDLGAELTEKDSKLRQGQVNATGEVELKKQLQRAHEIMKEKEERLAAFEQEGQNLAKKQSEMEKVVRTTKAEVKKRDGEILKLKDSKEQLVKAIEEMQDLVRKNELEASSATKSLSAMQAVSQASTDKLSRLEGDIVSKVDELSSQRRAMETAWTENNESKRLVAELRADRDDLRRQIGLGTSKVMETESSRRDIEQREAVLRATNKQLQDSLQRQMQESSVREERLRDEVGEMRKRWQEAITSRETLSSELGSATAPLLRQISSMQDSVRSKSEAWQAIEATLSERALRAESVAEVAEHRKGLLEDQTNELRLQVGLLSARLQESIAAANASESSVEKLKKSEASTAERAIELESRLALEVGQKQSFQSSLRELELRHKIDHQDAKDQADLMSTQREGQLAQLRAESQALREQLEMERKGGSKRGSNKYSHSNSQDRLSSSNSSSGAGGSSRGYQESGPGSEGANGEGVEGSTSRYGSSIMPDSVLPSGETSFAATERLQQQRQQKDEGTKSLNNQIQMLQASRDALLEEVNYLSAKNAKLEEDTATMPLLKEESRAGRGRIDMLLVLLGEKEEEVEAILGDLKEVRGMYKDQMEELMDKVVAASGSGSSSYTSQTSQKSIEPQEQ